MTELLVARRVSDTVLLNPGLGRVDLTSIFKKTFLPGGAPKILKEVGVLQAYQQRRFTNDGKGNGEVWQPEHLRENGDPGFLETIWGSVSHNERVSKGGDIQVNRVFGTVGTSSNGVPSAVAVASTGPTATNTHLSIGSVSANVTTNEFTTGGLARAVGTVQNYVVMASLGATFSVDIVKTFTASAGNTATGSALFDNGTTVSPSNIYVEAPFGSSAVLVSGDTLAITWTISN